nr:hypothetical protein [Pseudonocardia sp.]
MNDDDDAAFAFAIGDTVVERAYPAVTAGLNQGPPAGRPAAPRVCSRAWADAMVSR